MKICKPINTPLVAHFKLFIDLLLKKSKDIEYISHVPYSNAVESIMYILTCTRLDFSYAISIVSCYMTIQEKNMEKQ